MRQARLRYLAVLAGPALAIAASAPVMAGTGPASRLPWLPSGHARSVRTVPDTGPSAMAGFALVQAGGTLASHFTTYSSVGGIVSVNHTGAGQYQVIFGHLGFSGGDTQLSAISTGQTCSVAGWGPSSGDLFVNVLCYDLTGALADAPFYIMVTQPQSKPNGVLDYDWVYKASGRLIGPYQYNSSHKINSIRHPATGEYVVTMPGPGPTGASKGTVKVSAYGVGGGSCQIAAWRTTRTGEQITVHCFGAGGAPQNREFDITYTRGNNLMGQNGKTTANALASSTQAVYKPRVQFDSNRNAHVTIIHLDRGFYEAVFAGSNTTGHFSGGQGHIELTTTGGAPRLCGIEPLATHTPAAFVVCTDAAGHNANTAFTIQWVVN